MSPFDVKDAREARIGELARYFAANQPMRYGIQIVYSSEVEQCSWSTLICSWDSVGNLILQYLPLLL